MRLPPVLVVCLLPGACSLPFDAELLEVRSVAPSRIEPGLRLTLAGEGFPAGRPATVRFTGTFRRPGRQPSNVDVRAAGRAVADDRVEVLITGRLVQAFGGRGTFAGEVRLSFTAKQGGGHVSGRIAPVDLDVLPGATSRLAQELEHAREARRLLHLVGVTLARDPGESEGLQVASVAPDGVADRAGLRAGDRLVALDGVRLAAVSDFIPAPSAAPSRLRIERSGEATSFVLPLPLRFRKDPFSSRSAVWLVVSWALLAWLLLFVAPSARATAWLAGCAERYGSAGPDLRQPTRIRRLLELLVAGAAWVAFALGCSAGLGAVSAGVLVALCVGLRSGAVLVARRGAGTAVVITSTLPVCALVIVIALVVGSDDVATVVASQGAEPWRWLALRHPAGVAVLVPWLASLRPVIASGPAAAVSADRAAQLLLTGLGCALLLGGWASGTLGLLGFVLKSWLALSLARRAGVQRAGDHARWSVPLSLLGLAAAVATGLDLWPSNLETPYGVVSTAALGALLAHVVLSRVRRRRVRRLELHPFL